MIRGKTIFGGPSQALDQMRKRSGIFPVRQGRLAQPDDTKIKGRANSPSEPQFIPIRF